MYIHEDMTAGDVEVGHYLLDLNNGYVVGVDETLYGMIDISFHDADGNDCTLQVPENHPLTLGSL